MLSVLNGTVIFRQSKYYALVIGKRYFKQNHNLRDKEKNPNNRTKNQNKQKQTKTPQTLHCFDFSCCLPHDNNKLSNQNPIMNVFKSTKTAKNNLISFSSVLRESFCCLTRDPSSGSAWKSSSVLFLAQKCLRYHCSFCDWMPNCAVPIYEMRLIYYYLTKALKD